jgi:hypothetical protein
MLRFILGVFVILHGLVHLWYVTLSQRWVAFQPDMGWTGDSWVLSRMVGESVLRPMASVLFGIATLGFVASGIGIIARLDWWRPVLLVIAGFSLVLLLLFWDGSAKMLVQKGLLGVLINVGIILYILLNRN